MICLFPAVVWALDDEAETFARVWEGSLDRVARAIACVARREDEIREHLETTSRAEFSSRLEERRVCLPPVARACIVLVADAGRARQETWAAAEATLDTLETELNTIAIERSRIAMMGAGTGELNLAGVRGIPWLISTRLHSGHRLSRDLFRAHLCRLLDGLLLRDRAGPEPDGPSLFVDGPVTGHVRVYGYPRQPPIEVIDAVAVASVTALIRRLHGPPDEPAAESLRAMRQAVESFRNGHSSPVSCASSIFRQFRSWTGRQLLTRAPAILATLEHDLERPAVPIPEVTAGDITLWGRIKNAIRRLFGWEPAPVSTDRPPPAPAPRAGSDDLVRCLQSAREQLEALCPAKTAAAAGVTPPQPQLDQWEQLLQEELRALFHGPDLGLLPPGPAPMRATLSDRVQGIVEATVKDHLETIGDSWIFENKELLARLKEFLRCSLVFTGFEVGGVQPQPDVIASSIVLRHARARTHSYWPIRREPVLFGMWTVEAKRLAW